MNAFGRRNGGMGNGAGASARSGFGVARPMQGGGAQPASVMAPPLADQFPPLDAARGGRRGRKDRYRGYTDRAKADFTAWLAGGTVPA